MPLFYQHNINEHSKLGIWKITEAEEFFLDHVPVQRTITHPHKRLQHLAGRYLLKHLFPDFPHNEIVVADTRKPYLPYEQYHFSISHCGNYAAAIVSNRQRVGIDIEIPSEKINRISRKFLNEQEHEHFISEDTPNNTLTVLWSAKEAIYKWWGWGSVNFSEHILLQPFAPLQEGIFNAAFIRQTQRFDLQMHYKVFDEICLSWVSSDN